MVSMLISVLRLLSSNAAFFDSREVLLRSSAAAEADLRMAVQGAISTTQIFQYLLLYASNSHLPCRPSVTTDYEEAEPRAVLHGRQNVRIIAGNHRFVVRKLLTLRHLQRL